MVINKYDRKRKKEQEVEEEDKWFGFTSRRNADICMACAKGMALR